MNKPNKTTKKSKNKKNVVSIKSKVKSTKSKPKIKIEAKPTNTTKKSVSKEQPKQIKIGFFQKLLEKFKTPEKPKELPKMEHITRSVIVGDVMVRNPIKVDSKVSLSMAFEIMEKYRLSSLIVTENESPVGVINERNIISFFSSFVKMDDGSLEQNKGQLDELSKQPVSSAMTRLNSFVKKNAPLEIAIKLMNSYKLDQLPVIENGKLIGSLLEEHILSFIEKRASEQRLIESDLLVTGIDKLLDLVNANKSVTSKEASENMKIPLSEIEKWARILQSHGLLDIDFSMVGVIKLIKKER